ncbi:MAG: hypothetical protein H7Y17_08700 [Chlorobia bacterium]|nr:hypothetical protein [Fimbriimonadaceae bacterium]
MRKRWVWIGIAATALILAVFALIPRQPDGLDFIRKYRPKIERLVETPKGTPLGGTGASWRQDFEFEKVPVALRRELEEWCGDRFRHGDDTAYFDCGQSRYRVEIDGEMVRVRVAPSWLNRQWYALTNRISPPATK